MVFFILALLRDLRFQGHILSVSVCPPMIHRSAATQLRETNTVHILHNLENFIDFPSNYMKHNNTTNSVHCQHPPPTEGNSTHSQRQTHSPPAGFYGDSIRHSGCLS